jgi:hypothetical protein
MPSRTRKTARKSTGPIGVPRHQLAPRHERSSSGSNDPIGDLEAQVEQLQTELRHRNRVSAACGLSSLNETRPLIGPSTHARSLGIVKQKLEPMWMSSAWPLITCKYIVILYMRKYMYCMVEYTRMCPLTLLEWEPDHRG